MHLVFSRRSVPTRNRGSREGSVVRGTVALTRRDFRPSHSKLSQLKNQLFLVHHFRVWRMLSFENHDLWRHLWCRYILLLLRGSALREEIEKSYISHGDSFIMIRFLLFGVPHTKRLLTWHMELEEDGVFVILAFKNENIIGFPWYFYKSLVWNVRIILKVP